jgi:hypothetical protein
VKSEAKLGQIMPRECEGMSAVLKIESDIAAVTMLALALSG